MSMIYCHKHDRHYDSDFDTDCIECEEEAVDHCVVCGCIKDNDEYVSCPAHSFGEVKQLK